jgi:membrane protease YdiL (CAAX protease family)
MSFLSQINPRNILKALHFIDTEAEEERTHLSGYDYRPAVALFTSSICLILFYRLTRQDTFYSFLLHISAALGFKPTVIFSELSRILPSSLLERIWEGFWSFMSFILLPLLVIKLAFKDKLSDHGIALADSKIYAKWFLLLGIVSLSLVLLVSFRSDFRSFYPVYKLSTRSRLDLLTWELIYLIQIICVEFFFRGFLLKSCKTSFGSHTIFVMCLPYMMVHLAKPWIEAFSSVFFGFFLGLLAIRSRSIWGGVIVHFAMACSMDILSLLHNNAFPKQWFP